MSLDTDEAEHSIEMELPCACLFTSRAVVRPSLIVVAGGVGADIRKVFEGCNIKVVPILVGAISQSKETMFGTLLAPYLKDPETLFVVSSDFCHWSVPP